MSRTWLVGGLVALAVAGVVALQHGDKISQGLDKAGDTLDKKTGGKHRGKIDQGLDRTKKALEDLDGRRDDLPRSSGQQARPDEHGGGDR